MFKSISIGNVKLKNNLFLAPMAGYTDVGFRYLAKKYGAGLTYTELVSAKAISYGSKRTLQMLNVAENEQPCAIQLFGKDPEAFKKALQNEVVKNFDVIDLNMGCPAPKVVKNGEGSALLNNFELAEKIIRTCVENTDKPVTVKFRSGFSKENVVAVEFAKMCEKAGASAICLHPRTTDQKYAGHSDWSLFGELKKCVKIPIIASGDIKTIDDIKELYLKYKVDAFMIGRASLGNPYIFENFLNNGSLYSDNQKVLDTLQQIEILRKYFDDKYICGNMKAQLMFYLSDKKYQQLKIELCHTQSLDEMVKMLIDIIN